VAVTQNSTFPICPLCNEPVEIETAKTNADGEAIHEECYVPSLKANNRTFEAA
jgi:hypothetical protein